MGGMKKFWAWIIAVPVAILVFLKGIPLMIGLVTFLLLKGFALIIALVLSIAFAPLLPFILVVAGIGFVYIWARKYFKGT